MSTIWTYDGIENKYDAYRGDNCMKKFYESLINFEKKKIITLTSEEYESYFNQANCRVCQIKV